MKLLPVLLVVTPSIVRACTLIIYDDMLTVKKRNSQIITAWHQLAGRARAARGGDAELC